MCAVSFLGILAYIVVANVLILIILLILLSVWMMSRRFLRENFVQPIDQLVLQSVDRRDYHCAREVVENVRVVEVEEAGSQATMTAHETRPVRMKTAFWGDTTKQCVLEPVQVLEPHARKCLRVQSARGAVGCLQPAVANKGIAIASKRKTLDKLNCAQYSFHSVNDHQVVEEDDAEEDHHIQPVLVSTVDATVFPDCLNCCPGLCRTWRQGEPCG